MGVQIEPEYALLGDFGAALEWSQVGDCRNDAGMGKKHDLERNTASGQLQQDGLPERDFTVQSGDAGD